MKTLRVLLILLFISFVSQSQNKFAYKIYTSKGKKIRYRKMIKKIAKSDVVFYGELHNDPISHWLELSLVKDLYKRRKLILGAEMFESDNQIGLKNYLNNKISHQHFKEYGRFWKNYDTDYSPIIEFAKKNHLKFIASNAPRRYAMLVYHKGFKALDSLSPNEKRWFAPLPIKYDASLSYYANIRQMVKGHNNVNLPEAQAFKDATMAYFINKNFIRGNLFIHFNGAYHNKDNQGIIWYLKNLNKMLKIVSIGTVRQNNVAKLLNKNKNRYDYIVVVVVDKSMTKSY